MFYKAFVDLNNNHKAVKTESPLKFNYRYPSSSLQSALPLHELSFQIEMY